MSHVRETFSAVLVLMVLAVSGCAVPTVPSTITTPEGKRAWVADQVLIRVAELQNVVIKAQRTGGLPTAPARQIVTFCVLAERTLMKTPGGWQPTVITAWKELKRTLPIGTTNNLAIQASFGVVDTVLGIIEREGGV